MYARWAVRVEDELANLDDQLCGQLEQWRFLLVLRSEEIDDDILHVLTMCEGEGAVAVERADAVDGWHVAPEGLVAGFCCELHMPLVSCDKAVNESLVRLFRGSHGG